MYFYNFSSILKKSLHTSNHFGMKFMIHNIYRTPSSEDWNNTSQWWKISWVHWALGQQANRANWLKRMNDLNLQPKNNRQRHCHSNLVKPKKSQNLLLHLNLSFIKVNQSQAISIKKHSNNLKRKINKD